MMEDQNIEQIKDQYKNLYDKEVTIEYDEETGDYLILDKDGNIISRTKSLDEEINKLNEIQNEFSKSSTSSNSNIPPSRRGRGNGKIDFSKLDINVYYSYMFGVVSTLGSLSSIPSSCNTSYPSALSGKLKGYYGGLGDDTPSQLGTLAGMISGLAATTGGAISLCQENDDASLKELKELIDEFYKYGDINFSGDSDINSNNKELINYDDYTYMFDNMNELFDGSYLDIIEKFQYNLSLGYQKLLEGVVPETFDNIIEQTYLKNSNLEIGSEEYLQELKNIKEKFAKKIYQEYDIDNFDIEESNIPKYLWEDADNYHKSLLMLSYNNGDFDKTLENNFKESIEYAFKECNTAIKDITTFDFDIANVMSGFKSASDYYNIDIDKEYSGLSDSEKIKKIIEKAKELQEPFNFEKDRISKYTMEQVLFPNLGDNVDRSKCWLDSLKELGYFDNLSKEYDDDSLYENTFNYEFLTNISVNEGTDKVYKIIEEYYNKCFKEYGHENSSEEAGRLVQELFQESEFGINFPEANMNLKILNNMNDSYSGLVNDKLTLDASKANFKLGLLESLDTSDLTEADVIDARKLLGNDAKYLSDWQIKGYYKIYQSDQKRAKKLLSDTLYNVIQDGRGYEKAKNVYNVMTGEEQKKLLNQVIHNEILNDVFGKTSGFICTGIQGFSDGVIGSIRNVGDLVLADGKMDAQDYYLSYLQEMLSAGGIHNDLLKLDYNLSSSVGNMAIPMALSAFVSPVAMSAWIFAAETGSTREKALRNGEANDLKTFLNAAAHGLLAVGVEKTLGALKGFGAKEDELLKIFTGDTKFANWFMSSSIGQKFAKGLSNSVNETIEELVENAGGYGIDFLSGKDIDWQNIPEETWQTIYMTMLTTPFINMMGEGFQNNKHSNINRMHKHNLNGFDVEYSNAELLRFTDNQGHVDNEALFQYLMENGRVSNVNQEQCESTGKQLLELLEKVDNNIRVEIDGEIAIGQTKRKTDMNNYKVFNKDQDGVVTISKDFLFEIAQNGKLKEYISQYNQLLDQIKNGISSPELYQQARNLHQSKIGDFYISEIASAINEMLSITDPDFESNIASSQYFNDFAEFRNINIASIHNINLLFSPNEVIIDLLKEDLSEQSRKALEKEIDSFDAKKKFILLSESGLLKLPQITYSKDGVVTNISAEEILWYVNNNEIFLSNSGNYGENVIGNLSYNDISLIMGKLLSGNNEYSKLIDSDNLQKLNILNRYNTLKMNNQTSASNAFMWANTELLTVLSERFEVPISHMVGNFNIMTEQDFYNYIINESGYTEKQAKRIAGINHEGKMVIRDNGNQANMQATLIHEALHSCGMIDGNHRGFNETLTEFFTKDTVKEKYHSIIDSCHSGYDTSVYALQRLVDCDIEGLTYDDFKYAYFLSNDIEPIAQRVDNIMGPGYFKETLEPVVNTILVDSEIELDSNGIDKAFDDIILKYKSTK